MIEVTAAVIKQGDKILICQRAIDDASSLLWEFPGGKQEDGETLEQCIIREIDEELNLVISVIDVFMKTVYYYLGKEIHFTFFNCDIVGGEIAMCVHHDVQWVTAAEMKKFDFMPADLAVVDRLHEEQKRQGER